MSDVEGGERRGCGKTVKDRLKSTSIWLIVAMVLSLCAVLFFSMAYETDPLPGTIPLLLLSVTVFVGLVAVTAWRNFR
jgi:hypothetical protein